MALKKEMQTGGLSLGRRPVKSPPIDGAARIVAPAAGFDARTMPIEAHAWGLAHVFAGKPYLPREAVPEHFHGLKPQPQRTHKPRGKAAHPANVYLVTDAGRGALEMLFLGFRSAHNLVPQEASGSTARVWPDHAGVAVTYCWYCWRGGAGSNGEHWGSIFRSHSKTLHFHCSTSEGCRPSCFIGPQLWMLDQTFRTGSEASHYTPRLGVREVLKRGGGGALGPKSLSIKNGPTRFPTVNFVFSHWSGGGGGGGGNSSSSGVRS